MDKIYIIICGFADVVAGGPIYYGNKVRYMEQLGWKVIVIPTNKGEKVYIRGMERFLGPFVPFILDSPNEYTNKQKEKNIDFLESFVPKERGETIVETGTDYTNYWGEELARRIGAKHIIIFLDEQNSQVDNRVIDFYKFKLDRGELAAISKPVMQKLFHPYYTLPLERCISVPCFCSNVIERYPSKLAESIPHGDYNIGYIGRLEKPFFDSIVKGFLEFCVVNKAKAITIVFFGGSFEQKTADRLKEKFANKKNVKVIITGYIYPLPYDALNKMDVFVSGAGSAHVAAKAGKLSIKIDMFSYEPMGVLLDYYDQPFAKCPSGNKISDYLSWILIDKKNAPSPLSPNFENDWAMIFERFKEHIKLIEDSSPIQEYYNTNKLALTSLQRRRLIMRAILGLKLYKSIHNSLLYLHIWKMLEKLKHHG